MIVLALLATTALLSAQLGLSSSPAPPDSCQWGGGSSCPDPIECSDPNPSGSGVRQLLPPPSFDSETLEWWHASILSMREACQQAIGYNGSVETVPELQWTQTAYLSPQMHPYDRYFFDPTKGNGTNGAGYTVERYLSDLVTRYGGIDKALIWPTYTQIGIDDRNQWDMVRTLPGGPEALCTVAKAMKAAGVHVLWPYHPWDHSTRGQQLNNETDPVQMAEMLRDTCFDGFNGDTMGHIPQAFYDESVLRYKPIAMEPEGTPPAWDLNYATVGWAEGYKNDRILPDNISDVPWGPFAGGPPRVDKPKWITAGKRQNNWCERWVQVKVPSLQVQWFNGLGYETWENVWGTFNKITSRDGEALRRVGAMLRFFGAKKFLLSPLWVPHTPEVAQTANGVYGSKWPLGSETLWTLVNRNLTLATGVQLRVKAEDMVDGGGNALNFYDCYNGKILHVENGVVSLDIEAADFGCVLATPNHTTIYTTTHTHSHTPSYTPFKTDDLGTFLGYMRNLTSIPLKSYSPEFESLPITMIPATKVTPLRPAGQSEEGLVYVPASRGDFHFRGSGVEIEGGGDTWPGNNNYPSNVDVQFPWEPHPQRSHEKAFMQVGALYVDRYPVTNKQYYEYLQESNFRPTDTARWLMHWGDKGRPSPSQMDTPVTYVSLNDARAMCKHRRMRLPDVHEWTYLSQGVDGRKYPWGNIWNDSYVPAINHNFTNPGPEPVGRYPLGASPYGVEDLVQSVWQLTTEFQDDHTRSVLLRGGSNYNPWRQGECRDCGHKANTCANMSVPGSYDPKTGKNLSHPFCGSHWYFPPAPANDQWNKYYLMSDSWERAGTIGFRCVADAEDNCTSVCPLAGQPESSLTLPPLHTNDVLDWITFGSSQVRMSGANLLNATVMGTHRVVPGNTSVTWRGGSPVSHGDGKNEAWEISPSSDSFPALTLTAPPPPGSHTYELDVYWSPGTLNNGFAAVTADTATIETNITTTTKTTYTYRDGGLNLKYSPAPMGGGNCMPDLCIAKKLVPGDVVNTVDLSRPGIVDWVRAGGLGISNGDEPNAQAPWFLESKSGGQSLLVPHLIPEDADLSKYEGSTPTFTWDNGQPDAQTTNATGGVYTTKGTVAMTVITPASDTNTEWVLTLHVGCFSTTCRLDATSLTDPDAQVSISFAGKQTQDASVSVRFSGEGVTVYWGHDSGVEGGNLTFQAATLERFESSTTLQALVLRKSVSVEEK